MIDEDRVLFALPGKRRIIAWDHVEAVRRTILPNGKPALRLILKSKETQVRQGFTPDPWVLPLEWTALEETDLLAAMKRLAGPHRLDWS